MKRFNVLVSVPVEVELQIEAETEDTARALAEAEFGVGDLYQSGCLVLGDHEVVESWELN